MCGGMRDGTVLAMTIINTPITARERNKAVWDQAARALYAGRIDEYVAYWQPDGRYEVAYPIGGLPAVVEGHQAIEQLFRAFGTAASSIAVHDVRFHQTDDPDVAFVEERMVAELRDGGRYENRLVIRATFRDGLIAEIFEYYGERAHADLLGRLGLA
jgi:ketosteroid isomerase-like protein